MARPVHVELEIAREAYAAALDRWLADPHREEVQSRSRLELGAASRLLREALRADGERRFGVDPWAC